MIKMAQKSFGMLKGGREAAATTGDQNAGDKSSMSINESVAKDESMMSGEKGIEKKIA